MRQISALRAAMVELASDFAVTCHLPSLEMCTDNAAMIAAAGIYRVALDGPSPLDLAADPNWQLAAV